MGKSLAACKLSTSLTLIYQIRNVVVGLTPTIASPTKFRRLSLMRRLPTWPSPLLSIKWPVVPLTKQLPKGDAPQFLRPKSPNGRATGRLAVARPPVILLVAAFDTVLTLSSSRSKGVCYKFLINDVTCSSTPKSQELAVPVRNIDGLAWPPSWPLIMCHQMRISPLNFTTFHAIRHGSRRPTVLDT